MGGSEKDGVGRVAAKRRLQCIREWVASRTGAWTQQSGVKQQNVVQRGCVLGGGNRSPQESHEKHSTNNNNI
jgi:hypothetical protein